MLTQFYVRFLLHRYGAPVLLLLVYCSSVEAQTQKSALSLWYNRPAQEWVEALPVGNGSLGAMIFGGIEQERIQFNEDTLWTGVPRDYINPRAQETLPQVRKLLFEGKQAEAENVAQEMMSIPLRQEKYQPFADILLDFPRPSSPENYKRALDLNEAVATVSWQSEGVRYRREVFSSYPDQVLVIHLSADRPGQIRCTIRKQSPHPHVTVSATRTEEGNGLLVLQGQLQDYFNERTKESKPSALRFESQLRVEAENGELRATDQAIEVMNADAITLKLCADTSYKNFRDIGNDPSEGCKKIQEKTKNKSYQELKRAHIQDYQSLFHRMSIDFGTSETLHQPTDVRVKQFTQQRDPQLVALYYQYGRYLLLASSRPGSQPANLQGLWNNQVDPPWDSKYTVNINTEMNYWIAEMCNLSPCHLPLFDMLADLAITGGKVAREHYGARGWVLHHNTDLWRGAAPINASNHGIWMTGGAWLCQHLWLHYAYTLDREFLEQAYPVMKSAALFFLDFLVEDPRSGWLISTPSNSPENGGLVAGPTMDHQIIRNLFTNCIQASEILGMDEDFRAQLQKTKERMAPNQIGQYGQLQEWLEDKDDPKNQHRHVSHLWGLHPGNEITPLKTPELAEACRVTLQHRGDGGTGWSKAWKINFWARLHDGNHAWKMFSELIDKSTLPNLFDTHPPFQIDGNFGGVSGLTEMLLQSHTGEIHLLPALPDTLPAGSIKGVCARGGFELELKWKDGELVETRILSRKGQLARIRYGDSVKTFTTQEGKTYRLDGRLNEIPETP